jgi:hypothetical protein
MFFADDLQNIQFFFVKNKLITISNFRSVSVCAGLCNLHLSCRNEIAITKFDILILCTPDGKTY